MLYCSILRRNINTVNSTAWFWWKINLSFNCLWMWELNLLLLSQKCIDRDPCKRWTCDQLLTHDYFKGFSYKIPEEDQLEHDRLKVSKFEDVQLLHLQYFSLIALQVFAEYVEG